MDDRGHRRRGWAAVRQIVGEERGVISRSAAEEADQHEGQSSQSRNSKSQNPGSQNLGSQNLGSQNLGRLGRRSRWCGPCKPALTRHAETVALERGGDEVSSWQNASEARAESTVGGPGWPETASAKPARREGAELRVGIVGYELEDESTGVGRALAGLLAGAVRVAPAGWRFVVFLQRAVTHPVLAHPSIETVIPERPSRFGRRILWEQLELPSALREQRLDLVYSPSYSLPPGTGLPGVVTVHDLSFERLPEEFGWRERWVRRFDGVDLLLVLFRLGLVAG
jgi:hypothetical protein